MTSVQDYTQAHADRFLEQWKELLRIPSVSTLPEHAADVQRAAEWIAADMRRIGLPTVEIITQPGRQPLVYGEWLLAGPDAPTVLLYCHYDVQPAERENGWSTNPFDPVEQEGKLYARGAVDSKNHVVAHLKAVETLLATGKPPVNLKLLFEGEEESESAHIFGYVAEHAARLAADAIVISDGSVPGLDQVTLDYGLRGIVALEVTVSGPQRDLHSGHFGGTVHNPIQALAEILAQLHDDAGRVAVPGFYDAVLPLTDIERSALAPRNTPAEAEWRAIANAPQPWGEPGYTLLERRGARPTLEINGVAGGFAGPGYKTVIPASARATITCRLVPDQEPLAVYDLIRDYIIGITPPTVRATVRLRDSGARGVVFPRDTLAMQAVVKAYEAVWGSTPQFTRAGGSVPVVDVLQRELRAPIVPMPFGHFNGGAHGPDEHAVIEMFYRGIKTAIRFYHELAALHEQGHVGS